MAKPQRFKSKWRIRWTDHNGKRRSRVFNSKSDAAIFLKEREVETYQIKNGLRAPQPGIRSFSELCAYWTKYRSAYKRSGHHDESIIRTHLLPFLGQRSLDSIKPIDAESLRERLSGRSDKTIHNILTLLISMLNAAKDQGWIREVPKIKKPKITVLEKDFRYLKTRDEIVRFLTTAKLVNENAYELYAVAIHTGMRAGELGQLRFEDVDLDRNLIIVKGSWRGPTKSNESRVVPLLPAIRDILIKRRNQAISNYVFYNKYGRPLAPSDRIFQETLKKVLTLAKFPKIPVKGKEVFYVNFHGLRHTFSSHWMMQGLDLFKLQKVLGHQDVKMTLRYSHLADNAFGDVQIKGLSAIPDFQTPNVINLKNSPVRETEHFNEIPLKTPNNEMPVRNFACGITFKECSSSIDERAQH